VTAQIDSHDGLDIDDDGDDDHDDGNDDRHARADMNASFVVLQQRGAQYGVGRCVVAVRNAVSHCVRVRSVFAPDVAATSTRKAATSPPRARTASTDAHTARQSVQINTDDDDDDDDARAESAYQRRVSEIDRSAASSQWLLPVRQFATTTSSSSTSSSSTLAGPCIGTSVRLTRLSLSLAFVESVCVS
jgi:hypothetical protein